MSNIPSVGDVVPVVMHVRSDELPGSEWLPAQAHDATVVSVTRLSDGRHRVRATHPRRADVHWIHEEG